MIFVHLPFPLKRRKGFTRGRLAIPFSGDGDCATTTTTLNCDFEENVVRALLPSLTRILNGLLRSKARFIATEPIFRGIGILSFRQKKDMIPWKTYNLCPRLIPS